MCGEIILPKSLTRRQVLTGSAAIAGSAALGALGVRSALALTSWYLASPIYGTISGVWHSNALDIAAASGSPSVWAYFRTSSVYGYIEPTSIANSCETPNNPTHRILDFYCRTDGGQAYVGSARAQHVESIGVSVGNLYACPAWLAGQGSGGVPSGANCYTGLHVHYWANGSPVGTYSIGTPVYLDTPIMWQWTI